jgi:hypothetical protein
LSQGLARSKSTAATAHNKPWGYAVAMSNSPNWFLNDSIHRLKRNTFHNKENVLKIYAVTKYRKLERALDRIRFVYTESKVRPTKYLSGPEKVLREEAWTEAIKPLVTAGNEDVLRSFAYRLELDTT